MAAMCYSQKREEEVTLVEKAEKWLDENEDADDAVKVLIRELLAQVKQLQEYLQKTEDDDTLYTARRDGWWRPRQSLHGA